MIIVFVFVKFKVSSSSIGTVTLSFVNSTSAPSILPVVVPTVEFAVKKEPPDQTENLGELFDVILAVEVRTLYLIQ